MDEKKVIKIVSVIGLALNILGFIANSWASGKKNELYLENLVKEQLNK